MAEDYRSVRAYPAFKNFTGSTNWTEVLLPSNCSRVQVGSTGALYITNDATEGEAAAASSNKGFIVASNYLEFKLGKGSTRDSVIYIAGQSGTPDISVIIEE